jgi:hypothetical protein
MDADQRRAVVDIRAALARVAPSGVDPDAAEATIGQRADLLLVIAHSHAPVRIELSFGDGHLVFTWPGGKVTGGWDWKPEIAVLVEALLSGRNRQTLYRAFGRQFAVTTEIWDEEGNRTALGGPFVQRMMATLVSRLGRGAEERSISFDRNPAIRSEG